MQSHLAVQSLDGDILELQNGERPSHVAHCIISSDTNYYIYQL